MQEMVTDLGSPVARYQLFDSLVLVIGFRFRPVLLLYVAVERRFETVNLLLVGQAKFLHLLVLPKYVCQNRIRVSTREPSWLTYFSILSTSALAM